MSQERFTGTTQAPGSDGSSEQFHSAGPATGASTPAEDAGVGNSDGVHTPKLYSYVLTTGGMAEDPVGQGTICSKDTSTMSDTDIDTDAKALAVERSNMRFHQMLAKLNSIENIHSFEVTTETVPAATGVPVLSSTFTVTYLRQPVHPDPDNLGIDPGEDTVKQLAAEGINFDDTVATQMRHVWKPAKTVAVGTNPAVTGATVMSQIVHRENVTANEFSTVAALFANMGIAETIINPTHSLP